MPTDGVWVSPEGRKTFIPLENNPEVFTSLIHDLGVSDKLAFHDVYSLDEPSLLSMVPRPAHALIFITPAPMYYAVRNADGDAVIGKEGGDKLTYSGSGQAEPVKWFRQTIGNACGLIALLHAVANGVPREAIKPGSTLARLLDEATSLPPHDRADLLYNSQELEEAHMRAARDGQSSAPSADESCGFHFMAFTRGTDGHLWELEGITDGPLDRGQLPEGADMLSPEALEQGVRRFIHKADGNVEFSIIALVDQD